LLREQFFDQFMGGMPALDSMGPSNAIRTHLDLSATEELPVTQAQFIAIGSVVASQPFLSEKRKAIYTEYTLQPIEVLKNTTGMTPRKYLYIDELGGDGIDPSSGRRLHHDVYGKGRPIREGESYLFFLEYRAKGNFFITLKVWKIVDSKLVANAHDDIARVQSRRSKYDKAQVSQVVSEIKESVR
jgi:hypothetical protein